MFLAQNRIDIYNKLKPTEYGNLVDVSKFNVPNLAGLGIRVLLTAGAVGSFIFLLIGAVQWIFAGGDKEGIDKAKKKITGALIGLAIALSVFAIAALVNLIFGVNILGNLVIPTV